MRIEVNQLPPVSSSPGRPVCEGTGVAAFIGLFAGGTATIYTDTSCLFSSMLSPEGNLASVRTKLPAMFIKRPWASEEPFAVLTLQLDCFMSMQALTRAKDLFCPKPVGCPVDFLPAMCAVFEQTTTHRCDLTIARTVYFILFLPRRIGAKLLAASGARASHVDNTTERVDAEFSLRFIIPPENVSDYLSNLRVISPYYPCAGIKNKLGHVIEVSTLLVALIEQNTYPKSIVSIWHEALVGILNLPANPLLGFPCLARGIDSPIFVDAESGALFRDRLPWDSQMDADAGLRYSSRPCQNIRLGSNHIVNIPS